MVSKRDRARSPGLSLGEMADLEVFLRTLTDRPKETKGVVRVIAE